MRTYSYILFFLIQTIYFSCTPVKDKKRSETSPTQPDSSFSISELPSINIRHDLNLTANLGGFFYKDSSLIINVSVTIENPTDDTLQFTSMSCSYEDFFMISDTLNYRVQSRYDCYSNYPIQIALPPKAKTDRFIMVIQLGSFRKLKTDPIKIGMKIWDKKIIWSNELKLSRLAKEIYTD